MYYLQLFTMLGVINSYKLHSTMFNKDASQYISMADDRF